MTDEQVKTIREALQWYAEIECPGPAEEALAILRSAFPAEASGEADSKAIHWAIRCLQAAGEQSHSELLREYAKDVCVLLSSRSAKKTVPMELVERLRYQGIHTREWIVELFAKFGYTVTEGKEDGR